MLPPAVTGSGASVFEIVSTGAEVTAVVASGPVCGSDSFVSIAQPVLVMTVPFASGLFTRRTSCTEPDAPALTVPTFQVTTPPDRLPPAVAETNVVLAGSGSLIGPTSFEVML